MNAKQVVTRLAPPEGFRSAVAATLMAQIDDLNRRALEAAKGLTPDQLAWQPYGPAPGVAHGATGTGFNTIGMLLAHIAVAQTHITQVGLVGDRDGHVHDVIGITVEDEGMPLAPDAPPSPALAGKDMAFYAELIARAGTFVRGAAATLTDDELAADVVRPPRPDGTVRVFDRRWMLHHIAEHTAGHMGQILLLRRMLERARG